MPVENGDEEPEELGTAAKGKQGELIAVGKLLLKGYKVYLPVIDTGIDLLVDVGGGSYKEVQVKYREGDPTFTARDFAPRDSFYLMCYFHGKHDDDFWIIPSKTFKDLGRSSKTRGRDYVQLNVGKEGSTNYNALAMFHSNWAVLLSGASPEVRKAVAKALKSSKRVEGEHFKQPDFMREILLLMSITDKPLQHQEIQERLATRLSSKFSKWDLEMGKSNEPRWKKTAAFAFYRGLVPQKLVEAPNKNQWVITGKGRKVVMDQAVPSENLRLLEVERINDGLARLRIGNFGTRAVQLSVYEVEAWGKKSAGEGRIIEPDKSIVLSAISDPGKFQTGQQYNVYAWSNTGTKFNFKIGLWP